VRFRFDSPEHLLSGMHPEPIFDHVELGHQHNSKLYLCASQITLPPA
jgi:hypothetical protein